MATVVYHELFNEKPYAATLEKEFVTSRCATCFGEFDEGATIPCKNDACGGAFYCSEECRLEDQDNHKYECMASKETGEEIDSFVRLLARILTRRLVDGGFTRLSENFPENIRDRSMGDLISHQSDIEKCPDRSKEMAKHLKEFAQAFSKAPLVDDWKLVKRFYCVMYINCFSLPGYLDMNTGTGPTLGCGFYLNVSRFNHSCRPDLCVFFKGSHLSVRYTTKATDETAVAKERLALTQSARNFNRLTISYGFSDSFSDCYFPLRRHRRESLQFGYYFKCKCVLCSDEREAVLEEHAAPIECNKCGEPYVWKEIARRSALKCWLPSKAKLNCRKSCPCGSDAKETAAAKVYVQNVQPGENLKALELEWKRAISSNRGKKNAEKTIEICQPVWEKARSFWHRSANLRMNHLQERLFSACYTTIVRKWKAEKTAEPHALDVALETGEGLLAWFKRHNDLSGDATTMITFSFELAKLYEISASNAGTKERAVDDFKRASSWYTFAASLWPEYGHGMPKNVSNLISLADKLKRSAAAIELKGREGEMIKS